MFGIAEHGEIMVDRARAQRVPHALAAVRQLLAKNSIDGIVLTSPGAVSWATGAMNPPIDRTAATDVVWICVSETRVVLITTEIEAPRIIAEMELEHFGIDIVAVPWWDIDAAVSASYRALGATPGGDRSTIGSDGHPAFGVNVTEDIISARMKLCPADVDELRQLGHDAAEAVQDALQAWVPGESDFQIQSRIASSVESRGADCPVLLVGVDDRVTQFRHPIARGAAAHRLVMAVLVARRSGLHVALTRYASVGSPDARLAAGLAASKRIHGKVLSAHVPGASYGSILRVLDEAYAAEGHPGGWREHYQGGPIGYAQREFEISPAQTDSRWWHEPVSLAGAVAWNPSLPGGGKDEDTYIVGPNGVHEWVTTAPGWPTSSSSFGPRPDPLIL